LGQIEDASFRFAGTRFAGTPVVLLTGFAAVGEADELAVECGVELSVGLMSGVVAQIRPRENMNTLGQECESGCPGPSRQTHAECLL
jgi:hypothetical protein